jgi:PEP-CTERM motif
MNTKATWFLVGILSVWLAPVPATATPIVYDFSVTATSGPLSGTTASGSFTLDSSSVVLGGFNSGPGLLTALNFSWDGITYDATTANTGILGWDSGGLLTGALFGTDCGTSCSIGGGQEGWWYDSFGPNFVYGVANAGTGIGTITLPSSEVPEPPALLLLGAGLLGVAAFHRRRTRQRLSA